MSPMTAMSSWMEVAGWTLVHFVWQGGLIALMVAATLRVGRRWPSEARSLIACGGLAAMLVVPIATALVLSSTSQRPLTTVAPVVPMALDAPVLTPQPLVNVAAGALVLAPQLALEPTTPLNNVSRGATNDGMTRGGVHSWLPLVVWTWCAGVVFLLGRMAVRLGGVRRLRSTALATVPAPLRTACHEMASRLGLRVPFGVMASSVVDSPTVIGVLRPVILLPVAALANLSPTQVEAILAHELAHIRRHDYVVNLLQTVVETLLFHHPAVWWVSGRVRAEREHACDDIALAVCGDRVAYAAALTELEGLRGRDRAPALAATQGSLVARVRRILPVPVEAAPRSPGWVTTLLLGMVFTTGVVAMVDLPSPRRADAVSAANAVGPASLSTPAILSGAATEMESSNPAFEQLDLDTALLAEQPALHALQGDRGGGRPSAASDLADPFELELDGITNQHETAQPRQQAEQTDRLARAIEDAQRRAVDLADEAADIADEVAGLGSLSDQDRLDSLNRLMKRKEEMEDEVADIERGLDSTSAEFRGGERDASRALQDAANGIRESQLKEKIRYSRGLVRARSPEYAREFEEEIGDDIADLERALAVAAEAVGNSEGTGLEQRLQQPPAGNEVSFDWRVYETDHFDIYYYPALEDHLEKIAGDAERAYDQIGADLTHDLPERVSLVVFRTRSEFEQSNIVPGGNPDRIGSFADPVRRRIVFPIDEPPDQLHRTMLHELAHQFAFDIIPRTSVSEIPLWVDEGLADYMSRSWRPLDLMAVRDAALSDIVPRMSEFVDRGGFANARVAYNLGHAAFEFIEGRWGKQGVRQFLFSFRDMVADAGSDVYENAFDMSPAEFDDAFESYIRDRFQGFRDKERPGDYGRDLAPDAVEPEYLTVVSVEPSPCGDMIAAFAQNRQDRELDIVLLSAENGEVVRNLTQGGNQDLGFESFAIPGNRWNTVPWMSWSTVGDRLAYFVRTGRGPSLALHNVVTGDVEDIINLSSVYKPESPDISPDGRTVALSAMQGAVGDIYLLNLETRDLTNLTEDQAADYAPTFSPDGSYLVYLSRVSGNNKLFKLDLSTKEKTQLTFGISGEAAAQFVDDHTLVFSSTATEPDAPVAPNVAPSGDVFNIWTLDLDSGEVRQSTDTATGNLSTIVLRGQDENRIGFVTYSNGEYGIHTLSAVEPQQPRRPEGLSRLLPDQSWATATIPASDPTGYRLQASGFRRSGRPASADAPTGMLAKPTS